MAFNPDEYIKRLESETAPVTPAVAETEVPAEIADGQGARRNRQSGVGRKHGRARAHVEWVGARKGKPSVPHHRN